MKSTILIVDDQKISRVVLEAILTKAGYETCLASDGEQAWHILERREVALVVADVSMPKLDGFGLCKRMKACKSHRLIPIVLVTGADDVSSRISAFESGADDILPKPVINEELLARVSNLLRFSALIREQLQSELSKAQLERELALTKLRQEEEKIRNRLYHDVLFAATGGTLKLMDQKTMASLLDDWSEVSDLELTDTSEIGKTRRVAEALAHKVGLNDEATGDLVLCVSEAVTNALKFGTRVKFRCGLKDGEICLYVEDDGPGLERSLLPQVTLQKGYSTHSSMGMGFSLMLETMDGVGLCTGGHGTSVLLSKNCSAGADVDIDRFLERFSVAL